MVLPLSQRKRLHFCSALHSEYVHYTCVCICFSALLAIRLGDFTHKFGLYVIFVNYLSISISFKMHLLICTSFSESFFFRLIALYETFGFIFSGENPIVSLWYNCKG
ncbi:hypothetical protein S83_039003 [Arachis hypogaea]